MPWHIERDHAECSDEKPYAVVKDDDGAVEGCHATRDAAEDQLKALYAAEDESAISANGLVAQGGIAPPAPGTGTVLGLPVRFETSDNVAADATVIVVGDQEDAPAEASSEPRPFESDLVFEGVATDDGRFMALGSLTWREPPLTLLVLDENTQGGHLGAIACGHIDSIGKRGLSAESAAVVGSGAMDTGELGQETARRVEEGTLGGVSVDLAIREWGARDPDTGSIVASEDMEEDDWIALFTGALQFCVLDGVIGAATIVPFPAFADARVVMLATGELRVVEEPLLASAGLPGLVSVDGELHLFATVPFALRPPAEFRACAAGPLRPPAEWFADPQLTEPTVLTVTPEGRVYGHISTRECHNGYADRCLTAAPVGEGLHFHTGQLETAEGDLLRVGRITVKPHAPRGASIATVAAHYDDSRRVAAFVRAYDDRFGIAVAGVTRSDATPELLRDFLANPPSIDQRRGQLLGVSSVPVPGLPVLQPEARLVASTEGEPVVETLLLPPVTAESLAAAAAYDPREDALAEAEELIAAGGLPALADAVADPDELAVVP